MQWESTDVGITFGQGQYLSKLKNTSNEKEIMELIYNYSVHCHWLWERTDAKNMSCLGNISEKVFNL